MGKWAEYLKPVAELAAEAVAETLWPTRCAVCDAPGKVLCERCARQLPYLDWWRACRRCGAAYGFVQCCSCNPVALGRIGREELPFSACASATMFAPATGQIVRVFKDQGEQRLAIDMAHAMARAVPPSWDFDAVTYLPASMAAFRRRGFDHAELLGRQLAENLASPFCATLQRPRTRDQRKLSRGQRVANLSGRFAALQNCALPRRVLLVDDVFTTGATLCGATDALLAAGVADVRCITFSRV